MADRPLSEQLPADLPEDWTSGQIVAPSGADAGLSEQHGYNYLMAQVNAAQRALNTVNESFDTISGKRVCRFVIGTSTAGWTQADCDYLCDGEDDQAELKEAFQALIERGGGEIVVLSGEYNLTSVDLFFSGEKAINIVITGNPGSTVLNLESSFYVRVAPTSFRCRLFGLAFKAAGERPHLSFIGVSADIQSCAFLNVPVSYSNGLSGRSGFRFKDNRVEFDSETAASNLGNEGALGLYSTSDNTEDICVSGNFFGMSVPGSANYSNVIYALLSTVAVIENNTAICSAEHWRIQISGPTVLANNTVDGAFFLIDTGGIAMTGNKLRNCSIVATVLALTDGLLKTAPSITGNQLANTPIVADGPVNISCNTCLSEAGGTAIKVRKGYINSVHSLTPSIVGNFLIGGTIGIHVSNMDSAIANLEFSSVLIASNRIFGCAAAIQIDSNWSGCMVTDNLFDGSIVDNGTGNIIRLNSNDPGGGGTAGVASFKGRTGAVVPQKGDYTADMVGARPDTWTPTAADVGAIPAAAVTSIQGLTQAEYDALSTKDAKTLYLIKE